MRTSVASAPTAATGLRTGWTTGTCASAAAKAAAIGLVSGSPPDEVTVKLPGGKPVRFSVERDERRPARAIVVKDAGDDPDCTDGARITADVALNDPGQPTLLVAGPGVGTVTKPGLGLPVGGPAINPVPRRMVLAALAGVDGLRARPLVVTFSVPGGDDMATKTTNKRLGIIGGISILGTTGIVRPFSTAAYRASVVQQIDVAAAQGEKVVVLATGSRSQQGAARLFADLDPVCFVEVGDFTGVALRRAAAAGIRHAVFVGMAGKIAKLAAGVVMTHFHRSKVESDVLLASARAAGAPSSIVEAATATATARHFFEACIAASVTGPLDHLCRQARITCEAHTDGAVAVEMLMVDFDGLAVVARG